VSEPVHSERYGGELAAMVFQLAVGFHQLILTYRHDTPQDVRLLTRMPLSLSPLLRDGECGGDNR
jgi:hypothetical protein